MQASNTQFTVGKVARELIGLLLLIAFVILVNLPAIQFSMLYPEQPLMYAANQSIHSLSDFLNVYLHPQMLHYTIAFFRPSGHFLMYQLLAPILGWHHTQAYIIVNLIFLALTGYVLIKIYQLLFAGFRVGGYLAFGFYLMHPALILPRILTLHFEFAHTFFAMLGLYYFIRYTQSYFAELKQDNKLLGLALIFLIVATSFKEPALMLGGVYFVYFCLNDLTKQLVINRVHRNILILITVITLTLAVYLTLPWPDLSNPVRNTFEFVSIFSCIRSFFYYVFQIGSLSSAQVSFNTVSIFTTVSYPFWITKIIRLSNLVMVVAAWLVWCRHDALSLQYRRSLLFLFIATLLFLIFPIGWGMGNPWHFSLALLMISLMIGFGFEYILPKSVCGIIALGMGLTCFATDNAGIAKLTAQPTQKLIFSTLRNALENPPNIKKSLNQDSVIIIEDRIINSPYMVDGAGTLPFYFQQYKPDFKYINKTENSLFLKIDPNYSGTLFQYVYEIPGLREQAYPFAIEDMAVVPDQIIYQWLKYAGNIFCLSYDSDGRWVDRTKLFRANLKAEQERRHLFVNSYNSAIAMAQTGPFYTSKMLPYADQQLCEYTCDQDKICGGFNFRNFYLNNKHIIQCQFYFSGKASKTHFDATSTAYIREN